MQKFCRELICYENRNDLDIQRQHRGGGKIKIYGEDSGQDGKRKVEFCGYSESFGPFNHELLQRVLDESTSSTFEYMICSV